MLKVDPDGGTVRVHLLGGFEVYLGSRVIGEDEWRLRKAAALIKLLSLSADHRLHKDRAMDLLWPELGPEAAANNLHRALHAARRTLDPTTPLRYLRMRDEHVVMCPEGALRVDAEAFEEAAAAARRGREPAAYRAAIGLYTGELLPGDRYESWAENRRTRLRRLHLELLVELAGLYEERGELEAGIEALEQAAEEPAYEEAYVALVRLYALSGRRREALRRYGDLERMLAREPGGRPSADARRLYEEVTAGRFSSDLSSGERRAREERPVAGVHNLPEARASFVGRQRELAELGRALAMTSLLTLTGAGGAGKTRLALEAARGLVGAYPDGVWLVELAPLSEADLVPRAVAEAVGAREEPGRSLDAVIPDVLRDKTTLLLLDNCEHLVGAVARLAEALIQTCPRLKILATSREVLNIAGERVWRAPSLSVPEPSPTVEALERSEAARLFAQRAAWRSPGFTLTPGNARAVADICRRLDGIPLAIELAAARVGVLNAGQISERLGDSLGLLTTGGRTATPRQRTLRGALDWSYELLPVEERALFRRLSVFAGGFALEAAEEEAGPHGSVRRGDVLDLLTSLVDKSLVTAEAPLRPRYRLLEPVRQYALEKLDEAGEEETARRAHAGFFLRLAERAEPELAGAGQGAWLDRLDEDHGNLRAAMRWYADRSEPEAELRLAVSLWRFWQLRGHYDEGRGWLERALFRGQSSPPPLRAKALTGAGALAFLRCDYDHARDRLEEGLALYRTLGDERGVADAVQFLGSISREQGRYAQAESFHEEALALSRKLGDERGIARSLNYLGFAAWLQEDYDRATELCVETLGMFRGLGDNEGISWALINLGAAALYRGDCARAATLLLLQESLALSREVGYREGVAWSLDELGTMARREGRNERAAGLLRESLRTHRDLEDRWRAASVLEGLAETAAALRRFERAARLFGAAEALRESISAPAPPCERPSRDRAVVAARAGMGEDRFEETRLEGRAMALEQVFDYATSHEQEPPSLEQPAAPPVLTRREEEIADLVAAGLTNRRIAERLSVSRRTVDTHVHRILKKLGLDSREQVAGWAEEHGSHEARTG